MSRSSDQAFVFRVTANPVPNDAVLLHNCQRELLEADASRVDVILTLQFLELQRWMCRIALEETIGTPSVLLNIERQIVTQAPESPGGPGLHSKQIARLDTEIVQGARPGKQASLSRIYRDTVDVDRGERPGATPRQMNSVAWHRPRRHNRGHDELRGSRRC